MSTEIIFLSKMNSFPIKTSYQKNYRMELSILISCQQNLFLSKQNEFFPEKYFSCQKKFFWNLRRIISFQQKSILTKKKIPKYQSPVCMLIFWEQKIFLLSLIIFSQTKSTPSNFFCWIIKFTFKQTYLSNWYEFFLDTLCWWSRLLI